MWCTYIFMVHVDCARLAKAALYYMAGVYARKTYELQWRVLKSTESHNAGNIYSILWL